MKKSFDALAQRSTAAYAHFIENAQALGGLTAAQAATVFDRYKAAKAIKLDLNSHAWKVTHGSLWDRDVLRETAGLGTHNPAPPKPRQVRLVQENPASRTAQANPFSPQLRAKLQAKMLADGARSFAAKVAWVQENLPGVANAEAFATSLMGKPAVGGRTRKPRA